MAIPVFIAYAHADEAYRKELVKHLGLLEKQGLIRIWHDELIPKGADWEKEIEKHLHEARLIVFLVSADFFHSDYCHDKEMKRALERHDRGEARVMPVIVRPSGWKRTAIARLQALPAEAKPVSAWKDQDEAWLNVVDGIEVEVLKLKEADERGERDQQAAPQPSAAEKKASLVSKPALRISMGAVGLVLGAVFIVKLWPASDENPKLGPKPILSDSTPAPPPPSARAESQNAGDAPPPALANIAPMKFRKLPAGSFIMGSPTGEALHDTDETQHPAEVVAFEIGVHEVTQKQWTSVMGPKAFHCEDGCRDELPANGISWHEAIAFMNKLTELENKKLAEGDKRTLCYAQKGDAWIWNRTCTGYRLPTEAEWEYAARAGTTTAYYFGDDAKDLCSHGNGADQVAKHKHSNRPVNNQCDDGHTDLAPVGSFKPNPWGLYDMHGNVWEWVWDLYAAYPPRSNIGYAGPDQTEIRYAEPYQTAGGYRVLRGGSFLSAPNGLRSSVRFESWPSSGLWNIGFRCARASLQP